MSEEQVPQLTAWCVLIGVHKGREIEACDRIEFAYTVAVDGGVKQIVTEKAVILGPNDVSVQYPRIAIFDAAEGGREIGWLMPPPGAGTAGNYTGVVFDQEIKYVAR